ncbi:GrpB family protein [Rheinheimera sp. NSM]
MRGSAEWQRRLAFRDMLRANTELAQRYEQNKQL